MKKYFLIAFLAFTTVMLYAQEQINFQTSEGIYPEGIAYYPNKDAFFVSSITKGQIGMVDKKGNYSIFLDNKDFYSTVGLKFKNDKLYVAVGDLGLSNRSTETSPQTIARLMVFDVNTKALVQKTDLHKLYKGGHLANDLYVNDRGDVYITDSFSPVVYKVSANGKAEVFVENDLFKGEGVNLNGILEHPKGFLLVAKNNDGKLFKIDITTKKVSEVKLSAPIVGMDGLLLLPDGSLLVGQNTAANAYHKVVTNDDFATAYIFSSDDLDLSFATTSTLANGKAFFVNSYIGDLFQGKNDRTHYFIREYESNYPATGQLQELSFDQIKLEHFGDKISRKLIPSKSGSMAIYYLKKGAHIPKHSHPQQQISYIRSGKVKVIIGDNEEHILTAGEVLVIPGNVEHEFFALEDSEDIDVFSPGRDGEWILGQSSFLHSKKID